MTISVLLCSWALSVVGYALHQAQKDGDEPGLEFPGTRTHTFGDNTVIVAAPASFLIH